MPRHHSENLLKALAMVQAGQTPHGAAVACQVHPSRVYLALAPWGNLPSNQRAKAFFEAIEAKKRAGQ